MTMHNWRLSSAQFGALWSGNGQDRPPYPIDIVSTIPTMNAFLLEQNEIRSALAGPEHAPLRTAVSVLAEPEMYAEVSGQTVDGDRIRIVGAQRQQWSAIAVQLPGPSGRFGGDVMLGAGAGGRLAAQLIGLIPQNAGGKGRFERRDEEDETDYTQGVLQRVDTAPRAPRLEAAVQRAFAGRGQIRVRRGPRYGARREIGTMHWIDIAADGRYLIGPHDPNTAIPGGPDRLVATLDRLLTEGVDAFNYWAERNGLVGSHGTFARMGDEQ